MSVSKFETLPNEILIDLFENYLNSVDVLIAFGNGLNRRFTALVHHCQWFHLDLTNIRKKDFDHCMQSITIYYDRIESLSMSDYLSGQINRFLTCFPILDRFSLLGKFNLYIPKISDEIHLLVPALNSLSKTRIHTLSVKLIDTNGYELFTKHFFRFFHHPTIRRLTFDFDNLSQFEVSIDLKECNIQYLTLLGNGLTWNSLRKILMSTNQLIYLNIQLTIHEYRHYQSEMSILSRIQPATKLKTFILNWYEERNRLEITVLLDILKQMPNLRRLTVTSTNQWIIDGDTWANFIQTSLLLLTHLSLTVYSKYPVNTFPHDGTIKSFQKSFWIDKKNFNIYKTINDDDKHLNCHYYYCPIIHSYYNNTRLRHNYSNELTWSLPFRITDNNPFMFNSITALQIRHSFPVSQIIKLKLNNIKTLNIYSINSILSEWINTYINLSNVTEFYAVHIVENVDLIIFLIQQMKNLIHLFIDFNGLIDENIQLIELNKSIKRLDISCNIQHPLEEMNILLIKKLFPSIEHLHINTEDLHNIPVLNKYFPNLITLTFKIPVSNSSVNEDVNKWEQEFQLQVTFPYTHRDQYITIWLDENVFNDSYWYSTLNHSSRTSVSDKIRRFLKRFSHS